jgi:TorA maturation chaperone TorD
MNEPRIHFATLLFFLSHLLNEAYTEAKLNQQLAAVAKVLSTIKRKHHHSK